MQLGAGGVEQHEAYLPDRRTVGQGGEHGGQGDARRFGRRIAEGAGGQRRKGEALDVMPLRQFQGVAVAVGQQRVGGLIDAVDRPQAVNDMAVWAGRRRR